MKLNWTEGDYEGHLALSVYFITNHVEKSNKEKLCHVVKINHQYNNLQLLYWSLQEYQEERFF